MLGRPWHFFLCRPHEGLAPTAAAGGYPTLFPPPLAACVRPMLLQVDQGGRPVAMHLKQGGGGVVQRMGHQQETG